MGVGNSSSLEILRATVADVSPGPETWRGRSATLQFFQASVAEPFSSTSEKRTKDFSGGLALLETPIADVGKDSTDVQMDELSEEFMAEFSRSRAVKVVENTSLIDSDTTTSMQPAESTTIAAGSRFATPTLRHVKGGARRQGGHID